MGSRPYRGGRSWPSTIPTRRSGSAWASWL